MRKNNLLIFLQLIKVSVSLPVTFLCFAGFYLYSHTTNVEIWIACAGVFFLSSASSALNQIIEQKYDALMERTKKRPLPARAVTTKLAWIIVGILILFGTATLMHFSALTASLGILAIIWYILVYTLLKRVTPFATIPGALTGALPLLIGYTAAAGIISNTQILVIATFVFIWQIPHFWLLMLVYGKDYEQAGFPTLFRVFSERNLKFWTLGWIVTMVICSLGFVPFGIIHRVPVIYILLGINTIILTVSAYILLLKGNNQIKVLFHLLNAFLLAIICTIMTEI